MNRTERWREYRDSIKMIEGYIDFLEKDNLRLTSDIAKLQREADFYRIEAKMWKDAYEEIWEEEENRFKKN